MPMINFLPCFEPQSCKSYVILKLQKYRIKGNFRGKIILLFLWICLQPRKFNYAKIACSIINIINDSCKAILENLFTKETHPRKFCTSKIL